VPLGFLITAGLVALGMAASLWRPARSGPLGLATWFISAIVNESPFPAGLTIVNDPPAATEEHQGLRDIAVPPPIRLGAAT
jgi:hypothetical protein